MVLILFTESLDVRLGIEELLAALPRFFELKPCDVPVRPTFPVRTRGSWRKSSKWDIPYTRFPQTCST
jgi:hypothetical protein